MPAFRRYSNMEFKLPPELEVYRPKLLNTAMPFIRVEPQPARATAPWESKIGGQPYRPKGTPWPKAPDGRELFFLAQLNFAEMPPLTGFPTEGIVEFYINDDDLYGMDFDDGENPDTFRVLYFPTVVREAAALENDAAYVERPYDLLPHHPEVSHPLRFSRGEEVAPATDFRFWQHFKPDFFQKFGEREWGVLDEFGRSVRAQGHKVGGYAYFTQDDPRRPEDPMWLLFQLDSDEMMDLMWGDMGVAHFFIREQDLLARNFSKVLYDWDCL
jgi:uncharacterized protein YwqG